MTRAKNPAATAGTAIVVLIVAVMISLSTFRFVNAPAPNWLDFPIWLITVIIFMAIACYSTWAGYFEDATLVKYLKPEGRADV